LFNSYKTEIMLGERKQEEGEEGAQVIKALTATTS
jgi:hypothetical protein